MRGIVELWLAQLYKLTVLWPAWLLTPEGRKVLFSWQVLWRVALALAFAAALASFLYAALPADLALIGAGDLVAYFDVVAIAWLAGVGSVAKAAWAWLRRRCGARAEAQAPVQVAARRKGRTALRRRRPRRLAPPANDEGVPGDRWTDAA